MSKKDLHPSIKEFKAFVQKHPGLIKNVRSGNETWQGYYEKWMLLGEDDPSWERFKNQSDSKDDVKGETQGGKKTNSKKEKKELMNSLMKMVETIDLNKVEGHINQLNGAITNIQTLINQFQDVKKKSPTNGNKPPFYFNQD
ncbi:YlbD family protein [Aquibacillus salsiterrae]|uniref:YlbD family protein n=1 Tax=Aquibacillus salsiterrae TaxID=2950439 RepID=A0A9X3WFJ3_9BACI|nr:YlbD family protein [Aquibacillus salsiterrae]MDC3416504.1 YlbD family protein [Aquibacillus salsiterrae]